MWATKLSSNSNLKSSKEFRARTAIIPCDMLDLSQFRESLEAGIRIYGLEPSFPSTALSLSSLIGKSERNRIQLDAAQILDEATKIFSSSPRVLENTKLCLLITNQDIFADDLNFVFGLADRSRGKAVVSLARLVNRDESEIGSPLRIQERILKEVAHEVGHLLGLQHCPHGSCLMSFSNSLEKVDQKQPMICPDCRRKLMGKKLP